MESIIIFGLILLSASLLIYGIMLRIVVCWVLSLCKKVEELENDINSKKRVKGDVKR